MVFERQPSVPVSAARAIPIGACMNRIEANAFATNWIRAWNKKDVDAVLKHYVEDARFISPKAATFVGNPVIEGKKALSEYWYLAAKKIEKIEFKLDHIVWDSNELIFSMRRISTEFAAVPVNQ
jgi:ketosteroid isomerase-like protein